jgi:hypothetical protein
VRTKTQLEEQRKHENFAELKKTDAKEKHKDAMARLKEREEA